MIFGSSHAAAPSSSGGLPPPIPHGAPVPSRRDEASDPSRAARPVRAVPAARAAFRIRCPSSAPVSPGMLRTVLRCFSNGCRERIFVNNSAGEKCHTQLQDTSPVDIAETTLRADLAAGRFCVGRYKVTAPADFPHLQILVPTDFRFSWCLQILRTQIFCAEVSTFSAQVQGSPMAAT